MTTKGTLIQNTPLFSLGRVVSTPGAIEALEDACQSPFEFLVRHSLGDWGELCEDDKRENDYAVQEGNLRILSAYKTTKGEKLWIITEADRSSTCLLLPDEY